MATEEKKTPVKEEVKVTSGRDFVAAKPKEVASEPEKAPEEIIDDAAAKEAAERLSKLEAEFEAKKQALAKLEAEFAAKHGVGTNAPSVEGSGNVRGRPIPVEEQEKRPRHISEIDPSYNGKEDSLRELRK